MEDSDKDMLLQSLRRTLSAESNPDFNPDHKQQDEPNSDTQPESNQEMLEAQDTQKKLESLEALEALETPETPETLETSEKLDPSSVPQSLAVIEFRIQHLQNRQLILEKTQDLRKKAGYISSDTADEVMCGDSDEGCELEDIKKELKELQIKKEELEKLGDGSSVTASEDFKSDQQKALSILYKTESPHGGIYTLPLPQQNHKENTAQQDVKTTPAPDQIISVERLCQKSEYTQCPACEEIILTETRKAVSETMWLLCCLLSMVGCVAGCCLIPFYMDGLKKVHHQCPHCKAHLHTYRPL